MSDDECKGNRPPSEYFLGLALKRLAQGEAAEVAGAWLAREFRDNGFSSEEAILFGAMGYVSYVRNLSATSTGSETPYSREVWEAAVREVYRQAPLEPNPLPGNHSPLAAADDGSPPVTRDEPARVPATTPGVEVDAEAEVNTAESEGDPQAPPSPPIEELVPASPATTDSIQERYWPPPTPLEAVEERQWSIVPLKIDKKPLVHWKQLQDRLPTVEEIRRWEALPELASWGLVNGGITGRITLDFDGEQGVALMRSWGLTPCRRTPSGGYHLEVRHPGFRIKTLNSFSDKQKLGKHFPGLDIRGDGSYAVFCGRAIIKHSNPPQVGDYLTLLEPDTLMEYDSLPQELRDFIREHMTDRQPDKKTESTTRANDQGRKRGVLAPDQRRPPQDHLDMVFRKLAGGEGRNNAGFELACQLRDNNYTQTEALEVMQDYAARCPGTNTKGELEAYTDTEIRATVEQVYSRPAREPWGTGTTSVRHVETNAEAYTVADPPTTPSHARVTKAPEVEQPSRYNWPAPLAPEAFHGLGGEVVRLIEPHSEADPAALLVQFVTGFGSIVGRHAYFTTDGARQFANLYSVIVGVTAKGRKGTSQNQSRRILRQVDEEWSQNRVMPGLASGEGLMWAVRDPITGRSPIKEKGRIVDYEDIESDPGVADKRLLVVEPEFSSVLRVMERQSNTLSSTLRESFDTGDLRGLTKNNPAKATGAHISLVGHVTKDELRRELTDTSAANGFANRILWVCARRSKLLPDGGDLDSVDFSKIIERLQAAAKYARTVGEMHRDEEARAIWHAVYADLSEGKPGMFGAITSRADCLVVRLSLVYALLDHSSIIKAAHLNAALAVWRYCEDSARFIFGDSLGDPVADEILRNLRGRTDGMTRTDIRDLFQRNKPSEELSRALGALQEHGRARVVFDYEQEDQRRPTERWYAITAQPLIGVRH